MFTRPCFARPLTIPKLSVFLHNQPTLLSDSSRRTTPTITSTEEVLALISSISNSLHASQRNTESKPSSLFAKSVFASHKKSVGLAQVSTPTFTAASPALQQPKTNMYVPGQTQPARLDLSFLDQSFFVAHKASSTIKPDPSPNVTDQVESVQDPWTPLFESLNTSTSARPLPANPKYNKSQLRISQSVDTEAISQILITAKHRSAPTRLEETKPGSLPPTIKLSQDDLNALKCHLLQASTSRSTMQQFLASLFGHVPLPPAQLVSVILGQCAKYKYTCLAHALVSQIRRTNGFYGLVSTLSPQSFLSLLQLAWTVDQCMVRVVKWLRDMRVLGLTPCADMAGYLDALLVNCSALSRTRVNLNDVPSFQSLGLLAPSAGDADMLWECLCDLDWTLHLASARASYSQVQVMSHGGHKNRRGKSADTFKLLSAESLIALLQSTSSPETSLNSSN